MLGVTQLLPFLFPLMVYSKQPAEFRKIRIISCHFLLRPSPWLLISLRAKSQTHYYITWRTWLGYLLTLPFCLWGHFCFSPSHLQQASASGPPYLLFPLGCSPLCSWALLHFLPVSIPVLLVRSVPPYSSMRCHGTLFSFIFSLAHCHFYILYIYHWLNVLFCLLLIIM